MSAIESELFIRIKYTNSMLTKKKRDSEKEPFSLPRKASMRTKTSYFYFTHVPFHDKDSYIRLQLRRKPCCAAPIIHP
jgi:hypothetical protein